MHKNMQNNMSKNMTCITSYVILLDMQNNMLMFFFDMSNMSNNMTNNMYNMQNNMCDMTNMSICKICQII